MRRTLPFIATLLVGITLGYLAGSGRRSAAAAHDHIIGRRIEVVYPTGDVVAGIGGGNPQAATKRASLLVVKRRGESDLLPPNSGVWSLSWAGETYVACQD